MSEIDETIIATIRMRARSGVSTGHDRHPAERAYRDRCSYFHWQSGSVILFTHDVGHHSSGWFKNPDYERCRHLSLSFRQPFPERDPASLASVHTLATLLRSSGHHIPPAPFKTDLAAQWIKAIHGEDRRFAWEEGPFSAEGKILTVRHYRVFCDPGWQAIKPRGEVYSRELTAAGWRSWSEVQGANAAPNWVSAE